MHLFIMILLILIYHNFERYRGFTLVISEASMALALGFSFGGFQTCDVVGLLIQSENICA